MAVSSRNNIQVESNGQLWSDQVSQSCKLTHSQIAQVQRKLMAVVREVVSHVIPNTCDFEIRMLVIRFAVLVRRNLLELELELFLLGFVLGLPVLE